jgi:hypothetical protein
MDIFREVVRLKNIEAIRTLIAKYAVAADAYSPPDMMRPLFSRFAGWHCEVVLTQSRRDSRRCASVPYGGPCTSMSRR